LDRAEEVHGEVRSDGFKKAPVASAPTSFVSHTPGVELVMEAYEGYWRKVPTVKRIVYKSVPEATTRLAMLKARRGRRRLPLSTGRWRKRSSAIPI